MKYVDLREYCDSKVAMHTATRYSYCPLHKANVSAKGFVVTRKPQGYAMYCHSCKRSAFVKDTTRYTPPKSTVIKRIKQRTLPENTDVVIQRIRLPFDYTTEIPMEYMIWLQSYNVTEEEIKTYRIGYSPSYERLILPMYDNEELIYWQGRYLGTDTTKHKYLNIRCSRNDVMFVTGPDESNVIVIVEDIISAIAIQRAGKRALALLGSSMPDYVVQFLLQQAQLDELLQVHVWLDMDKRSNSIEYSNRLNNAFNIKSSWVSTVLDPKCYTAEEILEHLNQPQ